MQLLTHNLVVWPNATHDMMVYLIDKNNLFILYQFLWNNNSTHMQEICHNSTQ